TEWTLDILTFSVVDKVVPYLTFKISINLYVNSLIYLYSPYNLHILVGRTREGIFYALLCFIADCVRWFFNVFGISIYVTVVRAVGVYLLDCVVNGFLFYCWRICSDFITYTSTACNRTEFISRTVRTGTETRIMPIS